jgi:hypothetical protein
MKEHHNCSELKQCYQQLARHADECIHVSNASITAIVSLEEKLEAYL